MRGLSTLSAFPTLRGHPVQGRRGETAREASAHDFSISEFQGRAGRFLRDLESARRPLYHLLFLETDGTKSRLPIWKRLSRRMARRALWLSKADKRRT